MVASLDVLISDILAGMRSEGLSLIKQNNFDRAALTNTLQQMAEKNGYEIEDSEITTVIDLLSTESISLPKFIPTDVNMDFNASLVQALRKAQAYGRFLTVGESSSCNVRVEAVAMRPANLNGRMVNVGLVKRHHTMLAGWVAVELTIKNEREMFLINVDHFSNVYSDSNELLYQDYLSREIDRGEIKVVKTAFATIWRYIKSYFSVSSATNRSGYFGKMIAAQYHEQNLHRAIWIFKSVPWELFVKIIEEDFLNLSILNKQIKEHSESHTGVIAVAYH